MSTFATLGAIKKSILNQNTKTDLKVHLYKTYCRPGLYYCVECLPLNTSETNTMQKVESNTIKSLVGVRRRKRSTWLLAALGLNKTLIFFSVYRNLIENKYTRKIIEQVIEQSKNKSRGINKKSIVAEMVNKHKSNDIEQIYSSSQKAAKEIDGKYKLFIGTEEVKNTVHLLNIGQEASDELNEFLSVK
ncbi:hypothetical protein BpHYR1_023119 [Brachionus plicatilis]|uniref:Uncharacterized protein n=1 Tax=Brachionus plicatilis TaxID=10195 RepID=A0A3M7QER2_BRAPC|nr:hypothetical protein BpHYR1_023119 [Brachionus plicatilis]